MPEKMRKALTEIIGSKFYIWFLTLSVVVISAIWLYQMEGSGVLWVRVTGGIAVLPLAGVLRIVVKTKKDVKDAASDLKKLEEKHNYKLEKMRIKKSLPTPKK